MPELPSPRDLPPLLTAEDVTRRVAMLIGTAISDGTLWLLFVDGDDRQAPVVVPITAVCWVLLMVGAMITHGRLGQVRFVALNLVYLALAAFVAWGRFGPEQFSA